MIPETVVFCGQPFTGTTTSGVAQAITMPTITLPENNKAFVSVFLKLWWTDAATSATSVTLRQIDFGLNGGTKSAYAATQTLTHSGEHVPGYTSYDLTNQFTNEWTGTSMTCELDVTITGPVVRNIVAHLVITYTHDDTATTRVKTAYIPLDSPVGSLATTKPTSLATIPALDTDLPESTKTILGTWIDLEWCMGNGTVDQVVSMEVSSLGVHSTGSIEMALSTALPVHYTWDASFATNTSHTWHMWTTTNGYVLHPQAMLIVTYTYDAAATTTVFHSIFLPLEMPAPIGTSTFPTRARRDVWIAEANPTTKYLAAFMWWQATNALSGLNARLGNGSYITYTDGGSVFAGSNALMVRNDAAYVLVQGRNQFEFWIYTSSGATNSGTLGAQLLVCYTAPKSAAGVGSHTRTVQRMLHDVYDGNTAASSRSSRTVDGSNAQTSFAPPLPSDYFICSAGMVASVRGIGGANTAWAIQAQGNVWTRWDMLYSNVACSDAENGPVCVIAQADGWFTRWGGDADTNREDIEEPRRWRFVNSTVNAASQAVLFDCVTFTTFHLHTWTVSGTVSGSGGGTVTLHLHRAATGERLKTTSRIGNGPFSFTWYDATETLYVDAYENDNYLGRSAVALAV